MHALWGSKRRVPASAVRYATGLGVALLHRDHRQAAVNEGKRPKVLVSYLDHVDPLFLSAIARVWCACYQYGMGWDNHPEYGGPEPTWRGAFILALVILGLSLLIYFGARALGA